MNELLEPYGKGFELSEAGEVLLLGNPGLAPLHEAPLPTNDPENVDARVAAAQAKFRRHRSALNDRRDAIRDLADVLEFLRPAAAWSFARSGGNRFRTQCLRDQVGMLAKAIAGTLDVHDDGVVKRSVQ